MTLSERSDRERALDHAADLAAFREISVSEARERIMRADDSKITELLDAYDQWVAAGRLLRGIAGGGIEE